jgi:hypothetical protein
MSDSRSDSRPGSSRFDSRPGVRSNEKVYPGKSPKKACVRLLLLALLAAGVALAFAGSLEFRTWLRVERDAAPRAAALSSGVAALVLVCAAWIWTSRLRWVAVSPDGLRWLKGPRARLRGWDQYVGVRRGSIEITVWGEELKAGEYADVEFHKGSPVRISTHTVHGYDDLVAEIQLASAAAIRELHPSGGSWSGSSSFASNFGSKNGSKSGSQSGLTGAEAAQVPLRLLPDGLEWDGTHYRWEEIQDYEVAVGYLRIQPAKGTEYLRRLSDLGDWEPVLNQLEANVGPRMATPVEATPTADSPQSPEPAAVPSPC